MKNKNKFTVRGLVAIVMLWAYNNDKKLWKNLNDVFDNKYSFNNIESKIINKIDIDEIDPKVLLIEAINKSDYVDYLKFVWTFIHRGESKDFSYQIYSNVTPDPKDHPYLDIVPYINNRLIQLKKLGLDHWYKSNDLDKYDHYRYHINDILNNNKYYNMKLFPVFEGNIKAFDCLNIGSSRNSQIFNNILKYILENYIVPDKHYQEYIQIPDFLNEDIYNPRKLITSIKTGGFYYTVYLKAIDLKEIYNTSIKKHNLSYIEKPFWQYILSCAKHSPETKFFLLIS